MLNVWLYTLLSVLIVSAVSLVGIFTLSLRENRLRQILLYLVSFSAGALLGDAFLHLIPEAAAAGFTLTISFYVLLGIAVSFVMEKIIHWRHCHMPTTAEHPHRFAYMNLFGDVVHNFIDGLIIAASYIASIPVGIATTLAVLFHEIPQEIGDFGVLIHGGFTKKKALLLNFVTALSAVIGALLALMLSPFVAGLTLFLVAFAAGSFIYIASTDLIPELHKGTTCEAFHSRSFLQLALFILGIAVMYFMTFLG